MKIKGLRIASVKRTVLGRTFCRLLGDEMGAVAMEYVVIALLAVAATIGAIVYFGNTLKTGFKNIADMVNAEDKGAASEAARKAMNAEADDGATLTQKVSGNIGGNMSSTNTTNTTSTAP